MTTGPQSLYGQQFAQLTVLNNFKSVKYKNGTQIYWLCKCICGTEKFISASKLKSGHTKSCGCYRAKFRRTGRAARDAIYDEYKRGATQRNLPFELTMEDFVLISTKPCHYCGIENSKQRQTKRKSDTFVYNGIDRLDNNTGYTICNSVPCCKFCNRAKDTMSEDEFLNQIREIAKYRCIL